MCGIAGIVKFDPREVVETGRLVRMRDVQRHRGPDGEGLYVDGPVGLAHRRLAIVDITSAGQQPMSNEDGTVWITFNGEIYNHAALRSGLEARGHGYRSKTDTETIVHLYEELNEHLVERLRGMFAFAIWDRAKRRLMLARDRVGIKPLYYAVTERELIFASEIKGVFAAGGIRPRYNRDTLPEYLATRFVSGAQTFYRGVYKLKPGHILTWSEETGVRTEPYWKVPPPDASFESFGAEAARLRRLLEESVERHLMSDVPLGVFLSGGIDSSALAALVSRIRGGGGSRGRVQTFSVGFADPDANELPYARMAADEIGSEHREITVTPAQFFESLPRLVWHEDEPIAFSSSVPLNAVSMLARRHVKVVLTGEGADELFLGYNRYRVTFWNDRLGRPYWSGVPLGIRRRIRRVASAIPGRRLRVLQRTFLALSPGVRSLFLENFAVHRQDAQQHLLAYATDIDRCDPYAAQLNAYEEAPGDILDRLCRIDLQTYLHELLMKQDQMSMAASIESRVPFLDDELIEYVAGLPSHYKIRGWQTKAIFREAVKDLVPRTILTRPKMGFPVPVGRWLRGAFSRVLDEFVLSPRALARDFFNPAALTSLVREHTSGRARHDDRLWLLLNLEIWQRVCCEGEDPIRLSRLISRRTSPNAHAHSLGQDGRAVAIDNWRASAKPADPVDAVATP
jgi:asparagine synthase (glutamine-hydrolysing)